MLIFIVIILGVSLVLYAILGGADFGAGIVEIFLGRKDEPIISKALAPVWEANHVWLILAIVILFTGFPSVYASITLVLHIPLMLTLLGIIMRGCAFTFRNYDVPGSSRKYYTFFFRVSSFITPVFLGMILGAMILGRITFEKSVGFYEMFMSPWLNPFCIITGIFTASLFSYIASVFLLDETSIEKERTRFARFSRLCMAVTISFGILVFLIAESEGLHLVIKFFHSAISIMMMILAAVICPFIWYFADIMKTKTLYLKIGVCIQVTSLLIGWLFIQFPVLVAVKNSESLDIYNAQASAATLKQLLIACVVGLVLIVPGFVYLFRVFKTPVEHT